MPDVPDPAPPDVDLRITATRGGEHVLLAVLHALLPGLPASLEAVELVDAHLKFKVTAPAGAKAVVQLTASITDAG